MTDAPAIRSEQRGAVAIVTLDNPAKRNAFTRDMRRDLVATMDAFNHDPDVRAVVLTGAAGHFCVGADLSGVGGGPPPRLVMRETMRDVQQIGLVIMGAPKPYVAAVAGDAFGTGMSIALACDWVVGGTSARFGAAFARIGGYPEMALAVTLARRVGEARAKRLLMLCEQVRAAEAHSLGILDELVEGDPAEAALAYAERLAAAAPLSLAHIKAIYADGLPGVAQMMRMEADLAPVLGGGSEDAREGIAALREKREPRFTGR